jgi:hypothetical protein
MMRYSNLTTVIYYSNLLMMWVRYDETFLIKEKWWYLYIFAYTLLSIKSIHIYISMISHNILPTAISLSSTAICEWDMMRPPQSRKSDKTIKTTYIPPTTLNISLSLSLCLKEDRVCFVVNTYTYIPLYIIMFLHTQPHTYIHTTTPWWWHAHN